MTALTRKMLLPLDEDLHHISQYDKNLILILVILFVTVINRMGFNICFISYWVGRGAAAIFISSKNSIRHNSPRYRTRSFYSLNSTISFSIFVLLKNYNKHATSWTVRASSKRWPIFILHIYIDLFNFKINVNLRFDKKSSIT